MAFNRDGMADATQQGAGQLRVLFEIDDVENVPAWGHDGERKVDWYGLTSGRFRIETATGPPLEYSPQIQHAWSLRGKNPDYFVARLFEDLLSILPLVLEQVPPDIAARVANPAWRINAERWSDDVEDELGWDLGYLRLAPKLAFWRTGDEVFFQWQANAKAEGVPVWSVAEGQIAISATAFEAEVLRFGEELLACMEHRVHSIQQRGWQREDCQLDIEELLKEQAMRREAFHSVSNARQATDWRQVRAALVVLLGLMGEPITRGD
jgi:hypothetical protein